jgi:CHAT domain-containing protein
MFITDDPNLPWEAAFLGDDTLVRAPDGEEEAPYLGAQSIIGRLGRPDPKQDDPNQSLGAPQPGKVITVGVLAPHYEKTKDVGELRDAGSEAKRVEEHFSNVQVVRLPDQHQAFLEFLRGGAYPDIIHIAAHGRVGEGAAHRVGLPLLDQSLDGGKTFSTKDLVPNHVRALRFDGHTFVFLNMCFAAAGTVVLGQAVSLADTFAHAGTFGVIAPLWQVEDGRALQYALEFYRLTRTRSIAEAVQELRRRSIRDDDPTWLAYRFFGHPAAKLLVADDQ